MGKHLEARSGLFDALCRHEKGQSDQAGDGVVPILTFERIGVLGGPKSVSWTNPHKKGTIQHFLNNWKLFEGEDTRKRKVETLDELGGSSGDHLAAKKSKIMMKKSKPVSRPRIVRKGGPK